MPTAKTRFLLGAAIILLCGISPVFGLDLKVLQGHVPEVVPTLTPEGRLPATNRLFLSIGLPLRNQAELDELIGQLYDPRSTNYHKFLTPPEFTARFGPTAQDYQAVIEYAGANGLAVAGTPGNRVVLDVEGGASNVEQAFHDHAAHLPASDGGARLFRAGHRTFGADKSVRGDNRGIERLQPAAPVVAQGQRFEGQAVEFQRFRPERRICRQRFSQRLRPGHDAQRRGAIGGVAGVFVLLQGGHHELRKDNRHDQQRSDQ